MINNSCINIANGGYIMFQILANQEEAIVQNVYTPLPMNVHLIFCFIATGLYLLQYYRKGSVHYLLLMAAIDATIITQFWTSTIARTLLGISEIILISMTVFYHVKFYKKQKAENEKKLAARKEAEERAKAAEAQAEEADSEIVENAFDD